MYKLKVLPYKGALLLFLSNLVTYEAYTKPAAAFFAAGAGVIYILQIIPLLPIMPYSYYCQRELPAGLMAHRGLNPVPG